MDATLFPGDFGINSVTKAFADVLDTISGVQTQVQLPQVSFPGMGIPSDASSLPLLERLPVPDILGSLQSFDVSKLGVDPTIFAQNLASQAGEALDLMASPDLDLERIGAQASLALDNVVTTYPALAVPLQHLKASLGHSIAALQQAYLAGATLVPEQYQAAVTILAVGAASTALGYSLAEAAEARRLEAASRPVPARDLPLPTRYDLPGIMGYYNQRPLILLKRLFEVSYRVGSLGAKLWIDRNFGDGSAWVKNMQSRAEEFVEFVQGAGPAFIKIGQGVSVRPDILPEPYLRELTKLQDRVSHSSLLRNPRPVASAHGLRGIFWGKSESHSTSFDAWRPPSRQARIQARGLGTVRKVSWPRSGSSVITHVPAQPGKKHEPPPGGGPRTPRNAACNSMKSP